MKGKAKRGEDCHCNSFSLRSIDYIPSNIRSYEKIISSIDLKVRSKTSD